jgi:hypothetical protein
MSLKTMPGLGKSGTSRIYSLRSMLITGLLYQIRKRKRRDQVLAKDDRPFA